MTTLTRRRHDLQEVYQPYTPGQRCSMPECAHLAAFTVVLADHLAGWGDFREQDFTCPFICHEHWRTNGMEGRRLTNLHQARGWSEYWPLGAATDAKVRP